MIRFASLGSGSRGNALVVDGGETRLLLDCGFSVRSTVDRLARLAIIPEDIDGVLVTHEHSDHVAGAFKFALRYGIPVYLTHGTHHEIIRGKGSLPECHLIGSHDTFSIGCFEIQPFSVPHDAREPVQFVFSDGAYRLGVLTDTGLVTPHIVEMLRVCDALMLECNHDPEMLSKSNYPAMLKRRISGDFGHLENAQAASLLRQIETRQLKHVVAAHLSEKNNRPDLAASALALALDCSKDWIGVASQEEGFLWRSL